jgi:hypothetical protein
MKSMLADEFSNLVASLEVSQADAARLANGNFTFDCDF